jgi:hypothetical protein
MFDESIEFFKKEEKKSVGVFQNEKGLLLRGADCSVCVCAFKNLLE